MNLEKQYGSNGREVNILTMVKEQPEWSANRIQEGERFYEELQKLKRYNDRTIEEKIKVLIIEAKSKGLKVFSTYVHDISSSNATYHNLELDERFIKVSDKEPGVYRTMKKGNIVALTKPITIEFGNVPVTLGTQLTGVITDADLIRSIYYVEFVIVPGFTICTGICGINLVVVGE